MKIVIQCKIQEKYMMVISHKIFEDYKQIQKLI